MVPLFLLSAILELDDSPREGLKLSRIRPDDPRVLTSAWRNPRAPSGLPERPRSPTPVPGPSRQPSTTVRFQDLAADSDGEEEVPVKEDGMDVDEVEKTPPRKTRKTASSKKTPGPGRTESAGTKRKRAPTPTRKSKGKQRARSPEDEQGDNERAAGHLDEETEQEEEEMDEEERPKKKRAKGTSCSACHCWTLTVIYTRLKAAEGHPREEDRGGPRRAGQVRDGVRGGEGSAARPPA